MSTVPLHLSSSNTGPRHCYLNIFNHAQPQRQSVHLSLKCTKKNNKVCIIFDNSLYVWLPIYSSDICLYLCYWNFEIYVLLWVCRCLRIIFNSETAAAWWENCTKAESSLLKACIGFAENLRLSTCSQKVAVNNQNFFVSRYIIANREMKPCDLNYAAWIDELAALLVHIPKFY